MKRLKGRKPLPAMVVSIIALVFALAGTALAGVATVSVLSKKEKKQTRKIARAEISKAAPGLSVANAAALQGKPASAFASAQSEAYHEVGAPGEPPFQNGWTNSGGSNSTVAFYKDPLGVVHLKGGASRSTGGVVMFTLPPGYRPSQDLAMPTVDVDGSGPAGLFVGSNGEVNPTCYSAGNCNPGIDGLTFRSG